ncbi:hypothetical protein OPV22_005781 [Ensete ventricosum]|uniref:Uncharacterized protein n=1 Tax=Ensete ventricosum TaxID=4639 RepID=A0AAV8RDM1_ENSVE|nr:hypothetical protein OPV22_005781 [Ensete ventricosum]
MEEKVALFLLHARRALLKRHLRPRRPCTRLHRRKKLCSDGNSNEEDDAEKITSLDSSEPSTSRNDSSKLQGESFESFASNDVLLSSILVSPLDNSLTDEKETDIEDIDQNKAETRSDKSEASSQDGEALTGLRPDAPSDVLKIETGDHDTEHDTATSESEVGADDSLFSVEQYEKLETEIEVTQSSPMSKEIEAHEAHPDQRDDAYLVMELPERSSASSFTLFKSKMNDAWN